MLQVPVRPTRFLPLYRNRRFMAGYERGLGQIATEYTPAQVWDAVYVKCREMTTDDVCYGLLGPRPIYFTPEVRPKIPSWAWALVGAIAGLSLSRLMGKGEV